MIFQLFDVDNIWIILNPVCQDVQHCSWLRSKLGKSVLQKVQQIDNCTHACWHLLDLEKFIPEKEARHKTSSVYFPLLVEICCCLSGVWVLSLHWYSHPITLFILNIEYSNGTQTQDHRLRWSNLRRDGFIFMRRRCSNNFFYIVLNFCNTFAKICYCVVILVAGAHNQMWRQMMWSVRGAERTGDYSDTLTDHQIKQEHRPTRHWSWLFYYPWNNLFLLKLKLTMPAKQLENIISTLSRW